MARVQSQQILDALSGMSNLNGNTQDLLTTIQGLKNTNSEAITQMRTAADLLRRLLQSRGDMDNILNAVNRHGTDMGESVDRIKQALSAEPTQQQMQQAISNLEAASNEAFQAGLPNPDSSSQSSLNPTATTFTPGQSTGGNNKKKAKKKHHGGYAYPGSPNKSSPVSRPRKVNSKTKTRRKRRSLAGKRVSSKSRSRSPGSSKRSTRRRRSRR